MDRGAEPPWDVPTRCPLEGLDMHSSCRCLVRLFLIVLVFASSGCGKPEFEVGEVEGVVRIGGREAPDLLVEFLPDPAKGTRGPTASAETDAQGRYRLRFPDRKTNNFVNGAVVGWNRVIIRDLRPAKTALGIPSRVPILYYEVSKTPLSQEVKPGKQTIDLDVKER
jgi:hypothetical protein